MEHENLMQLNGHTISMQHSENEFFCCNNIHATAQMEDGNSNFLLFKLLQEEYGENLAPHNNTVLHLV
jgi:hypothetical protein